MKPFLIIQGHTNYVDFILNHYKGEDNIFWVTDETAPASNLNKILKSNIKLITIPQISSGYGNINLQVRTVVDGLKAVKEMGGKYAIKCRSDIYIDDLNSFRENAIWDDKIQMLAYVNHNCIVNGNLYKSHSGMHDLSSPHFNNWVNFMNYNVVNYANMNYIVDFFNYGPVEEMLLFWDYPFEQTPVSIPAEHKFIYRYLTLKGFHIDMSFEFLSNFFGWGLSMLKYKNINLFSLKHNCNWKNLDHATNREVGFLG
jgi:hypothetical protein